MYSLVEIGDVVAERGGRCHVAAERPQFRIRDFSLALMNSAIWIAGSSIKRR
jgi:hypothetical protein